MNFHHRHYGAGPPLIILHGLFGSLDNWATLAREWGRRFEVWMFDARNHGRSEHREVMDYPAMAQDLAEFMDRHGLEAASVLGHSMGGKTAMHAALTAPSRIERLVVVDIAPRSYARAHDDLLRALLAADPGGFTDRRQADAAMAASVPDEPTRRFLLKNLARIERGGFRWKMNLEVIGRSYDALRGWNPPAGRFDGPTLVVRGGRSRYVMEEDRETIQHLFPRAVIATIPQAGHWVHADAPADLTRVLIPFLQDA